MQYEDMQKFLKSSSLNGFRYGLESVRTASLMRRLQAALQDARALRFRFSVLGFRSLALRLVLLIGKPEWASKAFGPSQAQKPKALGFYVCLQCGSA